MKQQMMPSLTVNTTEFAFTVFYHVRVRQTVDKVHIGEQGCFSLKKKFS